MYYNSTIYMIMGTQFRVETGGFLRFSHCRKTAVYASNYKSKNTQTLSKINIKNNVQ